VHDIDVQTTQVNEWHPCLFHMNLWKKIFTRLLLPNCDPLSLWWLPLSKYPIKSLGSITYILEFGSILYNPTKTYKKKIHASFYDNIINHETKECFLKYLFHALSIMLDILIQINEGMAKFFALMVKDHLNKVTKFKCNTYINDFTLVH
jgi:hypothetical protein